MTSLLLLTLGIGNVGDLVDHHGRSDDGKRERRENAWPLAGQKESA